MRSAATFEDCARQALLWVAEARAVRLARAEVDALLAAYRDLPAFPEVPAALAALRDVASRRVAFSNGSPDAVAETLRAAGLDGLLDGVVSVREVGSFKPDPEVYRHVARRLGAAPEATWLVSANAWDALGAKGAGLRAAWVRRTPQPMDPWELAPDVVVPGLDALAAALPALG
jgi:2-haloacid dehalogenase